MSTLTDHHYSIFAISDAALTIDFGNEIHSSLNQKVIALNHCIYSHPFAGFIETVPAYSSLTVFYDVYLVKQSISTEYTAFEIVKTYLEKALSGIQTSAKAESRLVKIPVCYGGSFGPDLDWLCNFTGLNAASIIELHTSVTYQVYMTGFLPGFPYMGIVNENIAAPRKNEPSLKVAAGSVGIAGKQTGIYPLDSPGGWQILGRTPLRLFDPERNEPVLIKAGDQVRFYSIDEHAFNNWEG
ncbi:5-oxoprolinase subunit PxpB [Solitalea koreensis]|uniref:Inhibitor of KinA n=1 Tax=Solitalea koreensis TaxID=543615 RepID=A0A521BZG4_9SPHI|nr:5-oxoprolinase subunit PxpB [Solitalea koreensis]SMO52606.1 inhibitor of KinA [Solitalea koreensis]